jgi:uncharacterized protein YkwD
VHHSPAGPPLSARLHGALTRWLLLSRRVLHRRSGRLALGALLSGVLATIVVGVPVVSGSTEQALPVSLDASSSASSSSRSSDEDSPVVMGRDGRPGPSSTIPGRSTTPGADPSATDAAGGSSSPAPGTTDPAPSSTGSSASADAPSASEAAPDTTAAPPVVAEAARPEPQPEPEPQAPTPPAVPAALGAEEQVLALVNAARAEAGCGALTGDGSLASVARAHSVDMRDRGFFSHVNPDGLDPYDRAERAGLDARAENIAYGQQNAADVMEAWMDSSGHRANILDCELTALGVGVAEGAGGPWWTQLFA